MEDETGHKTVTGLRMWVFGDECTPASADGKTEAVKYTFETEIMCKENTNLVMVRPPSYNETVNPCVAITVFEGDAGCPVTTLINDLGWLSENIWLVGIFYLLLGPWIAFYGMRMFPYVVSTIGALAAFTFAMAGLATFGMFSSTGGTWLSIIASIAAAVGAGFFIRKSMGVTVFVISVVAGCYGGMLVFMLLAFLGMNSVWLMWVLVVVGGIVGLAGGWRMGKDVVELATSFIGSYLMMRALTCFFWTEHWPNESEIINGTMPDNLGYQFWIFVVFLVGMTWFANDYQEKAGNKHKEFTDEFERA